MINSVRHLSAVPVILIAALHIDTKPPCSIAAYLQTFPPLYFPRDFVLRLSLSKAGKPAKCRACGGLPSQGKALRPVILVKSRTQTGELPDGSPGESPPPILDLMGTIAFWANGGSPAATGSRTRLRSSGTDKRTES